MKKNPTKALQFLQIASDKVYHEGIWLLYEITHDHKEHALISKLISKNNPYGYLLRGFQSTDYKNTDLIEAARFGFSFPHFKIGMNYFLNTNDRKYSDYYISYLLKSAATKNFNICLLLSRMFLHGIFPPFSLFYFLKFYFIAKLKLNDEELIYMSDSFDRYSGIQI
jgi:hypothetical protein